MQYLMAKNKKSEIKCTEPGGSGQFNMQMTAFMAWLLPFEADGNGKALVVCVFDGWNMCREDAVW